MNEQCTSNFHDAFVLRKPVASQGAVSKLLSMNDVNLSAIHLPSTAENFKTNCKFSACMNSVDIVMSDVKSVCART